RGSRALLLAEPDAILGAFESLPLSARRAIAEAVAEDGRWRMAGYNLGPLQVGLARGLWNLRESLPYGRAANRTAALLQAAVQVGPAWGVHRFYRRMLALRGRVSPRPRLADVLAAAGVDPSPLAVAYAQEIAQLSSYRGYWHDAGRNTTVGLLVGLDFIE